MAIVMCVFFALVICAFVAGIAVGYIHDCEDRAANRAGWPLKLAARFDARWEYHRVARERGWK